MNLIQQAVERAKQLEQQGKLVSQPLPIGPRHGPTNLSNIKPMSLSGLSPLLAAALVATLALGAGALLYVFLAKTQAGGNSTAHIAAAPATPPAMPAPVVKTLPATTPAPAFVATAVAPTVTAAPAAPRPEAEARQVVERWARAWSERDVGAYLSLYGESFAPDKGLSRQTWEKARRLAIQRRGSIQVTVNELRIEALSESRVAARFTQDYTADNYRESALPKQLVLAREPAGWRIVAETSGAAKSVPL